VTEGVATCEETAEEPTVQALPVPSRRRARPFVVFLRRCGKVVLSLISIAVLTVAWYGWHFVGDPNEGLITTQVFDDEEPHVVPLDGAVDILLVGIDSRTDDEGNPLPREVLDALHAGEVRDERNTDTMILVHIPQNGQRAVAISFPRDSFVDVGRGFGKHKLNSAFVYAYNDKASELQRRGVSDRRKIDQEAKMAGRKNLISTLERLIGKPGMIDRYAEVNLASFYEITKALGGVDVCLNHPAKEVKSGINLPAGRQKIEGVQALAFVRQRYGLPNYDLDRIARQQAFLSGLARKVLSKDVLMNPGRISDVIAAVKKSVVLSDNWDLVEFAAQMRGLNSGKVEFHTIPVEGNANIGGADVLKVDPAAVHDFTDGLTADSTATKSTEPTTNPARPSSSAPSVRSDGTAKRSNAVASTTTAVPSSSASPPITAGDVPCVN
jgi:LCP family protein required for cell wall assembly